MNTFNLAVIDVQNTIYQEDVTMAVIPGTEGDIGVLHGHTPVLTTLRTGEIKIYKNQILSETLAISGGFAKIDQNGCAVFVS